MLSPSLSLALGISLGLGIGLPVLIVIYLCGIKKRDSVRNPVPRSTSRSSHALEYAGGHALAAQGFVPQQASNRMTIGGDDDDAVGAYTVSRPAGPIRDVSRCSESLEGAKGRRMVC